MLDANILVHLHQVLYKRSRYELMRRTNLLRPIQSQLLLARHDLCFHFLEGAALFLDRPALCLALSRNELLGSVFLPEFFILRSQAPLFLDHLLDGHINLGAAMNEKIQKYARNRVLSIVIINTQHNLGFRQTLAQISQMFIQDFHLHFQHALALLVIRH
ncbi:MAG: hypothetical protein HYT15_00830 [Candidatus Magasanikbacteria bacterium]|nr:hypothetical protein [Candidatus Magasanikbacteria bacterium]